MAALPGILKQPVIGWGTRMGFPYKEYFLVIALGLLHVTYGQAHASTKWGRSWTGDSFDYRPCLVGFNPAPRDYRDNSVENQRVLRTVEAYHFDQFVGGSRPLGSDFHDLDYTLAWFPNHHKALYTVIRRATEPALGAMHNSQATHETRPECRLGAAEHLFPDDGAVQFLFGLYLHRLGRLDDAVERYARGVDLEPNSAQGRYNFALLLLEMGRFEEAREQAKKAYSLGHPLLGLKRKLDKAGYPL